ncbi:uncharacterized protein LOC132994066 isoform X1 [Labrus mixtus]|uniref:uncharacterized protein LOC132994066 isoform X1 n=1 Tax=Labrus mixtus TaxID=508554 RepID=UPI0029C0A0F0|nr:uncharacterized protein LOC132994066 isoform X1 [Labrus mixtus]
MIIVGLLISDCVNAVNRPRVSLSAKMSSRILYITLFLFFLSFFCSAVSRGCPPKRGPSKQHCPRPCCKAYSEAVVSTDVIGDTYHEVPAHALCFKALIFKTPNGRVCVDPHEEWAQKLTAKMKKLRRLQI